MWLPRAKAQLVVIVAGGLIADGFIYTFHLGESVSEHVWDFGNAHPILNYICLALNVAYGYLVRADWKLALLDGVVACHLWPAPIN